MKHRDYCRRSIHPLESERDVNQHASQRIQRRQNRLPPQLRSNLRPHHFHVANRKVVQRVAAVQRRNHSRRYTIHAVQLVEVRDDSAVILIARRQQISRQRVVTIRGARARRKRIFLNQHRSQLILRGRIEIRFARLRRSPERLVQHVQNRLPVGVQVLVRQPLALEADHHVVLRSAHNAVADRLNGAVRQTRRRKTLANLIEGRRAREANINQSAALKIDAVLQAALLDNRGPTQHQQNQRKRNEVLRLANPIDVDVSEQFHCASFPPLIGHRLVWVCSLPPRIY